MLTNEKNEMLKKVATQLRRDVIEMTYKAQSGHPGGSCSLADIMAYLYFYRMRYDVKNPKSLDRDRLVLSKGHAAPIWYAALAEAGFFPKEEMKHLREIGYLLQGHPCVDIPGVDATTGSLVLVCLLRSGWQLRLNLTKEMLKFMQLLETENSMKVKFGKQPWRLQI